MPSKPKQKRPPLSPTPALKVGDRVKVKSAHVKQSEVFLVVAIDTVTIENEAGRTRQIHVSNLERTH